MGAKVLTTVCASAITVGATWNKELALARGYHMGLEAKVKGGETAHSALYQTPVT